MKAIPFHPTHFHQVNVQDAQQYVRQYVEQDYLEWLATEHSHTAVSDDGKVLACMGWIRIAPGRSAVWAYVDRDAGKHFRGIHRLAQQVVASVKDRRVEAEVDCDFEQGHRWMKLLGFDCEAPRMRAASSNGGDMALYARVKYD